MCRALMEIKPATGCRRFDALVRRRLDDHLAQLAAARIGDGGAVVEDHAHVAERLRDEIVVERSLGRLPCAVRATSGAGCETQLQAVGSVLHDLKMMNVR